MVLDDVQLNFGDFLSSKASRASVIFTFFSVSLKNLGWVNPRETIYVLDQSQSLSIVF